MYANYGDKGEKGGDGMSKDSVFLLIALIALLTTFVFFRDNHYTKTKELEEENYDLKMEVSRLEDELSKATFRIEMLNDELEPNVGKD